MNYKINKGVGRSFEFKGLRAMYVFLALGGIVGGIILYFILGAFLPFGVITNVLSPLPHIYKINFQIFWNYV